MTMSFLLVINLSVGVEASDQNKGNIDWKINRIKEKVPASQHEENNEETEMEKLYPDLFKVETMEKISKVKRKKNQDFSELREELFTTKIDVDDQSVIEETKHALFPSDYQGASAIKSTEESNKEYSSTYITVIVVIIACSVGGGIFFMFRRLLN